MKNSHEYPHKNYSHFIFVFCVMLSLTACQGFSPNYRIKQHPLIDQIWSVAEQKYITADSLKKQIQNKEAILLGETHDNARHHQLQALVINSLVKSHRAPAVAFEMLSQDQQSRIEQFQLKYKSSKDKTDAFAKAVDWEKSGWPQWPYYCPVFHSTIENDLPIIAANLELKLIRSVIKQGSTTLDTGYQDLLNKYQYDAVLKKELEQDILSAHCDLLPEKMLSPMLLGQQVRDLAMTRAMQAALSPSRTTGGVVLIAGSGHTRKDYGVPYYLQQEMPDVKIISIAFLEVNEDKLKAEDYAQDWVVASKTKQQLPFDYVWFTPQAEREDQCEKMKAHMKKKDA